MFKSLKNIDSSFKQVRFVVIVFLITCAGITGYSVYSAYNFAEAQRQKIYVLDQGKSLMLALAQDLSTNRPVEARAHVCMFHELFFTIAPDKQAIEGNVRRALFLADRSAYNCYKDLEAKGYYNRMISANINQKIQIDSVICNFNHYPYAVTTYAKQLLIRETSVTERNLVTRCNLLNTVRTDNSPFAYMIEKFEITNNEDIKTIKR